MNLYKSGILFSSLVFMTHQLSAQETVQYPDTRKDNSVKDNYHGTIIQDPYRWLENDTSKETEAWVKVQNKLTNSVLEKLPEREDFKNRLTEVWDYKKEGTPHVAGKYITYFKNDGLQNQAVLYIKNTQTGKEEVLLDPNKLSKDGTVAIGNISFSKTQKYFAYTLSAAGSDWKSIHIMDLATKKEIKEPLTYIKFTGIEWIGDKGFYYSRYAKPENEATKFSAKTELQKVYFHKVGEAQDADQLVYEDPEHPLRYLSAQVTENEQYLIINISEGTSGNSILVKDLKNTGSNFISLTNSFDNNTHVLETLGDKLVLFSDEGAGNYKLYTTQLKGETFSEWNTLIPEREFKLDHATIFGNRIFCTYLKDACSKIVVYDENGNEQPEIFTEGEGYYTISGFNGKKNAKFTYYAKTSFTEPTSIWKYDLEQNTATLHFKPDVNFDINAFETEQLDFTSAQDGTVIKMFMIKRKGTERTGTNPTMLYGYGGFNISLTPGFNPALIPFLEQGGIYCVVNLRGGSEYGEQWHKDGMLDRKQNVFNDFISAAQFLIEENYTAPQHLAIRGGSNGGLLVGACMTQRPDLFKVAIPQVGVLDMLRYHKFTVGWGWVVEYGSSEDPDGFENLLAYSPLHNVKKDTCYPATLITTADHDDRVVPAHSFKFAAELQDKQSCDNPVLIRIDTNAGHGAGKPTSKIIEEYADIWSFMMHYTR